MLWRMRKFSSRCLYDPLLAYQIILKNDVTINYSQCDDFSKEGKTNCFLIQC